MDRRSCGRVCPKELTARIFTTSWSTRATRWCAASRPDRHATLTGSRLPGPPVRALQEHLEVGRGGDDSRSSGTAYEFLFASLAGAGGILCGSGRRQIENVKLDVADLPGIKNIKVTYHFPSWLGLKDAVEDPGGDLRAVAGTSPN